MGFATQDYIERKKRTVPLMEQVANVSEFAAHVHKKEHLNTIMFKYAVKIIKGLQHDR
jgi:hypothetical protein